MEPPWWTNLILVPLAVVLVLATIFTLCYIVISFKRCLRHVLLRRRSLVTGAMTYNTDTGQVTVGDIGSSRRTLMVQEIEAMFSYPSRPRNSSIHSQPSSGRGSYQHLSNSDPDDPTPPYIPLTIQV